MIIVHANEVTYLSIEDSVELVSKIKDELKENSIAKEICKENGFDPSIIDGVVIKFDDIETSAETINGEMTLNNELVNEEFTVIMRYAVHELVHVFQHMEREGQPVDPYKNYEYLDRPDEQEAFKAQIRYEAEEKGEKEVEDYVDELLDYHDIPEQERTEKKEELLGG